MPDRAVLRISRFASRALWSSIDATLRAEVMPHYRAQQGLMAAWIARHGPELDDERVIASVWESAAAERASLWVPGHMSDELHSTLEDPVRSVVPVAVHRVFAKPEPAIILRIFEGRAHEGELDAYVEDAHRGALTDAAEAHGPASVSIAINAPDGFITVSTWTDWASIERCTGGDMRRPDHTRSSPHLLSGHANHYELLSEPATG